MKIWILLAGLIGFAASSAFAAGAGGNLKITPAMLQFNYMTFDSGISLDCTQVLSNPDTQDWDVTCGKGTETRKYTVHLWVTEYDRPVLPKQSFEVLYWVTDMTSAQPVSNGTTFWLHFREPSDLYQIQARVSLDQDTAGLYLVVTPAQTTPLK